MSTEASIYPGSTHQPPVVEKLGLEGKGKRACGPNKTGNLKSNTVSSSQNSGLSKKKKESPSSHSKLTLAARSNKTHTENLVSRYSELKTLEHDRDWRIRSRLAWSDGVFFSHNSFLFLKCAMTNLHIVTLSETEKPTRGSCLPPS